WYRDILLAVDTKRDRVGVDRTAELHVPERLAVFRIEREEIAFFRPAEDETARRRQHAVHARLQQLEFPSQLARRAFERAYRGVSVIAVHRRSAARGVGLARR